MTNTATPPATSPTAPSAPVSTAPSGASDQTTLGILSLVFGILGVLSGTVFPLSIVAIVLGILALRREPRSRTLAIWGIITGALPFALGVLGLTFAAAFFVPLGLFSGLSGFDFGAFNGFDFTF